MHYVNKNPYLFTFLLGDKSYINQDVLNSYQENGISHLFAISGMHITLLANLLEKILKKRLPEEDRYKVITVILIIYLFLVGFSPSIVRGVGFYIVFRGNNIYYFYIKKENLFLLVLSISLWINPYYIYDTGFQYSYWISYALLKMSNQLNHSSKIISLLKVSSLSFLVSIPITLKNYDQLNLLSILYNMFYVPYISMIVFPFSLIVAIIRPLEPILLLLTNLLEKSSMLLSKISIGKLLWIRLPDSIYWIYFIIIFIFLQTKKKRIIILFILLLLIHFMIPYLDQNNYVEFLDVGQGDSILIRTSKKKILIDTGVNVYDNVLKPTFRMNGIKKIDVLILTHGDFDHMGEAINLVNNFKVEKVIFNCGPYNDLEKELIKVLDKKKIKYYSCIEELNIDKNKLYFLQTKEYDNENENSNVIYMEINHYKFLFMGDAGVEKEKDILEKYNISNIDVLKIGHHGSKTSSSKEFINNMNPKNGIISVGKNNKYGHPNKEVLNNLKNSQIYRTDEDGSIIFKIKNNRLKIETCSP